MASDNLRSSGGTCRCRCQCQCDSGLRACVCTHRSPKYSQHLQCHDKVFLREDEKDEHGWGCEQMRMLSLGMSNAFGRDGSASRPRSYRRTRSRAPAQGDAQALTHTVCSRTTSPSDTTAYPTPPYINSISTKKPAAGISNNDMDTDAMVMTV